MMKLSIITINYNNCEGLERTFRSVFSQTSKDFEYVVIDGGSNDGSKELIGKNSDKITYWVSEKDKGIYNAMNKGIAAAKGEYLLFLNSGDELFETKTIEKILPHLSEFDLISGNLEFVYEDRKATEKTPEKLSFRLFYEATLYHPCTFIRREMFAKVGSYDEALKIVSDWKWFATAALKHDATYKHIEQTVSCFYFDGISSSEESLKEIKAEREKVLDESFAAVNDDYQLLKNSSHQLKKAFELEKMYNRLLKTNTVTLAKKLGFLKTFQEIKL